MSTHLGRCGQSLRHERKIERLLSIESDRRCDGRCMVLKDLLHVPNLNKPFQTVTNVQNPVNSLVSFGSFPQFRTQMNRQSKACNPCAFFKAGRLPHPHKLNKFQLCSLSQGKAHMLPHCYIIWKCVRIG